MMFMSKRFCCNFSMVFFFTLVLYTLSCFNEAIFSMGDKFFTSVLLMNKFSNFVSPESGFKDFRGVPLALRVIRLLIFESGPKSLIWVFSIFNSSSKVLPSIGLRLLTGLFCILSSKR